MWLFKRLFFSLITNFVLFFVDLLTIGFLGRQPFSFLLARYCIQATSSCPYTLIMPLFFLSLLSFILHGYFGLNLALTLALALIGPIAQEHLQGTFLAPLLLLLIFVIGQNLLIESFILKIPFITHYTLIFLFANMILIALFLKCNFSGRRGNR